jgi:hypothetical protein
MSNYNINANINVTERGLDELQSKLTKALQQVNRLERVNIGAGVDRTTFKEIENLSKVLDSFSSKSYQIKFNTQIDPEGARILNQLTRGGNANELTYRLRLDQTGLQAGIRDARKEIEGLINFYNRGMKQNNSGFRTTSQKEIAASFGPLIPRAVQGPNIQQSRQNARQELELLLRRQGPQQELERLSTLRDIKVEFQGKAGKGYKSTMDALRKTLAGIDQQLQTVVNTRISDELSQLEAFEQQISTLNTQKFGVLRQYSRAIKANRTDLLTNLRYGARTLADRGKVDAIPDFIRNAVTSVDKEGRVAGIRNIDSLLENEKYASTPKPVSGSAKFLQNLKKPETVQQLSFALLFGGLPTLAGAAIGGGIGGGAGALVGSTITQFLGNSVGGGIEKAKEVAEILKEAGLAFERSIVGITAIGQSNTDVVSKSGGVVSLSEGLKFQSARAKEIQLAARSKLLPIGIAGQTESTFVQGIVSALSQRGLQGTPQQVARLAELIGGAIQTQRPSLLENTTLLLRDIQDVLGGGPLAQRTVLSQLVRPALTGNANAKTTEQVVAAFETLNKFPQVASNLDNPVVTLNKLEGALDNLRTAGGVEVLNALTPAFKELFEVLSKQETIDAVKSVGESVGQFASLFIKAKVNAVDFGQGFINNVINPLKDAGPQLLQFAGGLAAVAAVTIGTTKGLTRGGAVGSLKGGQAALLAASFARNRTASGEDRATSADIAKILGISAPLKSDALKSLPFIKNIKGEVGVGSSVFKSLSFGGLAGGALGAALLDPAILIPLVIAGLSFGGSALAETQESESTAKEIEELKTKIKQYNLTTKQSQSGKIDAVLRRLGLENEFKKIQESQLNGPTERNSLLRETLAGLSGQEQIDKGSPLVLLAQQAAQEGFNRDLGFFNEDTLEGSRAANKFKLDTVFPGNVSDFSTALNIEQQKLEGIKSPEGRKEEEKSIRKARAEVADRKRELERKKEQLDYDAQHAIIVTPADEQRNEKRKLESIDAGNQIEENQKSIDEFNKQLDDLANGISQNANKASDAIKDLRLKLVKELQDFYIKL